MHISNTVDSSTKVDITTMPSGHAKATVGDTVLAETETWEEVEGNVYFPPGSVKTDFLSKTDHSTHCPWKGDASYYSIHVDGQKLENAAWYYPQTKDKAEHIRDHVAFCKSGMFFYLCRLDHGRLWQGQRGGVGEHHPSVSCQVREELWRPADTLHQTRAR